MGALNAYLTYGRTCKSWMGALSHIRMGAHSHMRMGALVDGRTFAHVWAHIQMGAHTNFSAVPLWAHTRTPGWAHFQMGAHA